MEKGSWVKAQSHAISAKLQYQKVKNRCLKVSSTPHRGDLRWNTAKISDAAQEPGSQAPDMQSSLFRP